MTTDTTTPSYKGFRFPQQIIAHAVWLYHRFNLNFRAVEELLFARGVTVTYETIRQWCRRSGQTFANQLRHRRARPGEKWHLDEVFLKIGGQKHYLWRAVDQDGNVLDILVQSRRNKGAAKKFFRKPGTHWVKSCTYVPRVIITDKLASSGAAKREVLLRVEHRQRRYLTIAPKTRTTLHASVSGFCSGSSPPTMPSVSSLPLGRFGNTFVLGGIVYKHGTTALNALNDSGSGTKLLCCRRHYSVRREGSGISLGID